MNTNGQAKAGLNIYAFDGTRYADFNGVTDANGRVVLDLLDGGYRFLADCNGTHFWSSAENDCTIPGCASATVTLPGRICEIKVAIDYTNEWLDQIKAVDYGDWYQLQGLCLNILYG